MPAVADTLGVTPEWLMYGPRGEEGADRIDEPRVAAAPPWCAPEAFKLLELYYACDADTRKEILVFIESAARGEASGAASNEG